MLVILSNDDEVFKKIYFNVSVKISHCYVTLYIDNVLKLANEWITSTTVLNLFALIAYRFITREKIFEMFHNVISSNILYSWKGFGFF